MNVALLLGLWLVWGYSWSVSKIGLPYISPLQMAFWRTALGVLTLGLVLYARTRCLRWTPFWPTFWLGMTQTAGFTACTNLALLSGGAGRVSVLAYTMPFWTLLLARWFLGERLHALQWGAVLLAFGGLALILQPWALHAHLLSSLLALGGGALWACSAIIAKRLRLRHQVSTLALTFWQMFWGLIPLGLLALLTPAPAVQWNWQLALVLLYIGVLATGIGWLVWLLLLARLSAGMAGLNVLAIPAVAVLLAWLSLAERPDGYEAAGMTLVALALAMVALLTWRREKRQHAALPISPNAPCPPRG
jgi:drug/metabolite transporter (DMT)-like permease